MRLCLAERSSRGVVYLVRYTFSLLIFVTSRGAGWSGRGRSWLRLYRAESRGASARGRPVDSPDAPVAVLARDSGSGGKSWME